VLEGKVIGRCVPRHRHQEFIRFIATVERSVPAGKGIHAILDNYAAHKHPQVLAWLAEHPRWTFHFTPTSCSWLNAVEGFFSKLTRQSLKRGVFRSVDELESAITRYIAATNRNPTPFVWTATAKTIHAKLTLNHPSESAPLGSFTRFRGDDVLAMLEAERRLNFGAAQQYQGERGVSFKTSRNPNIMHDANRVKPKLRFF
jgi:transposase